MQKLLYQGLDNSCRWKRARTYYFSLLAFTSEKVIKSMEKKGKNEQKTDLFLIGSLYYYYEKFIILVDLQLRCWLGYMYPITFLLQ